MSDFSNLCKIIFLFSFFKMFVYFWERQKQSVNRGGAERARGRYRIRSRLRALSCQHRAQRGARTHKPEDHDPSRSQKLNQLSHPGAPGVSQSVRGKKRGGCMRFLCCCFFQILSARYAKVPYLGGVCPKSQQLLFWPLFYHPSHPQLSFVKLWYPEP